MLATHPHPTLSPAAHVGGIAGFHLAPHMALALGIALIVAFALVKIAKRRRGRQQPSRGYRQPYGTGYR